MYVDYMQGLLTHPIEGTLALANLSTIGHVPKLTQSSMDIRGR